MLPLPPRLLLLSLPLLPHLLLMLLLLLLLWLDQGLLHNYCCCCCEGQAPFMLQRLLRWWGCCFSWGGHGCGAAVVALQV
jgi:hypothetical protein